jgi:hypothetical protein
MSRGPDYANIAEGQFCQMSTKNLYPICTVTVTNNCFNVGSQMLVIGGVSARDLPYRKVIDWSSTSS